MSGPSAENGLPLGPPSPEVVSRFRAVVSRGESFKALLHEHRENALTCYDHPDHYCCVCGEHMTAGYETHLAAVLALRERKAKQAMAIEAVKAFRDLHPMHGNTAGCYGGIGGAAITSECAIDCPNPKHEQAQEAWRDIERVAYGDRDPDTSPTRTLPPAKGVTP